MRPPPASVNPKPPRADQRRRLERLRAELARLDRSAPDARGVRPLGLAGIDRALPGGGLPRGCLARAARRAPPGGGAGLCRGAARPAGWRTAAMRSGSAPRDELFGPGLAELGLPPERLLVVRARARDARLWALEEALRSPGLVAALAEVDRLSLIQSRRLQLAAETRGVSALLLRPLAAGASPSVAADPLADHPARQRGARTGPRAAALAGRADPLPRRPDRRSGRSSGGREAGMRSRILSLWLPTLPTDRLLRRVRRGNGREPGSRAAARAVAGRRSARTCRSPPSSATRARSGWRRSARAPARPGSPPA